MSGERPKLHARDASTAELLALAERVFVPNYRPAPMVLERGEGVWLYDREGTRYLDLAGGVAVSSLGHAHPRLVRAIAEQAGRLVHASNLYFHAPAILLAERILAQGFGERVFFANSGAEANEAAIKLARRHAYARGDKDRVEIVALHSSFHGRTMGALAATGQPKYREGFEPLPLGFLHVEPGDVAALAAACGPRTAAILVEPIQGEGGVRPMPPGYLAEARRIADRTGALLVFDEIQTGFGRTGKMWCHQHEGVAPDVMTLAKGIAGGLPLGALVTSSAIASALAYGTHGTTFGGNPVAAAAGLAVLEELESPGFLDRVSRVGARLSEGLRRVGARHFSAVRGRGLLIGAELLPEIRLDAKAIVDGLRDRGVLAHIAGPRVLRLAPPLILGEDEADHGLAAIERTLEALGR